MKHRVKNLILLCMGTWEDSAGLRKSDDGAIVWLGKLAVDRGWSFAIVRGAGTRGGFVGRLFGGAFGAGVADRADDLIANLEIARAERVFIAGFSRGIITSYLVAQEMDELGKPVQAVGLFDSVSQRGIPWIGRDGLDRSWPHNVGSVFHAMAADEDRVTFPLKRWTRAKSMWFPGRHGDIGGTGSIHPPSGAPAWIAHRMGLEPEEADPMKHSVAAQANMLCKKRSKLLRPGDRYCPMG